jgi:pyruvate,orthophosphate dikinase
MCGTRTSSSSERQRQSNIAANNAKLAELGLLDHDPFDHLDEVAVGELIDLAVERGRAAAPGLKVGVCGEHAGHPASIRRLLAAGVDYLSCSPARLPVARLAAARAVLGA